MFFFLACFYFARIIMRHCHLLVGKQHHSSRLIQDQFCIILNHT